MIKINICNLDKRFTNGVVELKKTVIFETSRTDGIKLTSVLSNRNFLEFADGECRIAYADSPSFFKGFSILMANCEKSGGIISLSFDKDFDDLGIMFDCSRNAVLSVQGAKKMIRYLALLGYDSIMLYTEDTIEVKEYPYFGYMRGRYSKAEIQEIESYCELFGIELIPCIQTLAHLNQAFRWQPFKNINDVNDILLIDADETYEFLDKYLKACSESFKTRKIHIGMDEAHMVGLGKYLDKHGYTDRVELMIRHLKRVMDICARYGFEPMMWSDMFFSLVYGNYYVESTSGIPREKLEHVPKDISLVYWDYYSHDKARYDRLFKLHQEFGNEIIFAGGAWTWKGFVPDNAFSIEATKTALSSARENKIKKIVATLWGDDGGECPFLAVLPTLAVYSEENYHTGAPDTEFSYMTGLSMEDFLKIDLPAKFPEIPDSAAGINPSKYLLFQDLLGGLFDKNYVAGSVTNKYAADEKTFFELAGKAEGDFKTLFTGYAKLCQTLAVKAELGQKIRTCYKNGEKNKLREISNCIVPKLIENTQSLYESVREIWLILNKPYGIEVLDARYGGLIQRIKTTKVFIDDYLDGNTSNLAMAEENILPYCGFGESDESSYVFEPGWKRIFTASVVSHS